jgi:hypothetical protein
MSLDLRYGLKLLPLYLLHVQEKGIAGKSLLEMKVVLPDASFHNLFRD